MTTLIVDFEPHQVAIQLQKRTSAFFVALLIAGLIDLPACRAEEPSVLPFVTTDVVVKRNAVTGQTIRVAGVIEELRGELVELRRAGGNRTDRIPLREISELIFHKSEQHNQGLLLLQEAKWSEAAKRLEEAADDERRDWVVREIQASQAVALRSSGQTARMISVIEQIAKSDPDTRHVVLLPLIWNDRDSSVDRSSPSPESTRNLSSESSLIRLMAASALLANPTESSAAIRCLQELRVGGDTGIQQVAEVQLWRRPLISSEELRDGKIRSWQRRAPEFSQQLRGYAEFLIGRAKMIRHEYDAAARHFLWMPLM
ncbi:MAG: hypothetical protein ACK50J_13120, partial [Planctomyces sp.]